MKVKIDIDSTTFVRFFLVFAAFVLVGYLIMRLSTPLMLIFVSFFLAIALNPPVSKVATLIPGHSRILATAISYIIVLSMLGGLIVVLVPPAIEQSVAFVRQVPGYIEILQDRQGPLYSFLQQYGLQDQLEEAVSNAKESASDLAQQIGATFASGVYNILNGLFAVLTVLVLTFLMLIEGPAWMRRIWSVYIDEERRDRHKELARRMYGVVTAYVNGQLLVAFIAALSTLITLLVLSSFLDVPVGVVLPLSAVVLLTSMIPMIGATLGGLIVTIALLFNDVTAALIFLAFFVIYQQIENNLVQPIVQSKSVDLSALAVIIAVLLGITLAGLVGGLVAIPIAASLKILINHYLDQRKKEATFQPDNMIHRVKKAISGNGNDKQGKAA